MTVADVEVTKHRSAHEHDESDPERPPTRLQVLGNDRRLGVAPRPSSPSHRGGQQEQSEKSQSRFQDKQDREVEPDAEGISVAQDKVGRTKVTASMRIPRRYSQGGISSLRTGTHADPCPSK